MGEARTKRVDADDVIDHDEAERRSGGEPDVVGTVRDATQDMLSGAGDRISEAAEQRKNGVADKMANVANGIHRAADELGEELPLVPEYVHLAGTRLEVLAEDMRGRDLNELVDAAQSFARRRPTVVAGVAALLGFTAVRFLSAASREERADAANESGGDDDFDGLDAYLESDAAGGDRDEPPSSGDPGGENPAAPGFAVGRDGSSEDDSDEEEDEDDRPSKRASADDRTAKTTANGAGSKGEDASASDAASGGNASKNGNASKKKSTGATSDREERGEKEKEASGDAADDDGDERSGKGASKKASAARAKS